MRYPPTVGLSPDDDYTTETNEAYKASIICITRLTGTVLLLGK